MTNIFHLLLLRRQLQLMIKQVQKLLSSQLYRLKQCTIIPSSFEAAQCQSNKHRIIGRQIFWNQTSLSQQIRFNFCSKKKSDQTRYIGATDFGTLSLFNLYVDKTLFIEQFTTIAQQSKIMFPRSFGKTTTISMIQHYFEFQKPGSPEQLASQNMFFGEKQFKISKHSSFKEQHFQKYGVIRLDFSRIKFNRQSINVLKQIKSSFATEILKQYQRHSYILEKLSKYKQESYQNQLERLKKCEEGNGVSQDYYQLTQSIRNLSRCLQQYHRRKVIILIDEYDSCYQELLIQIQNPQIIKDFTEYFNTFYQCSFKSNNFIYRALVTGELSVQKKSMMSGVNHFSIYDITSFDLADYYGMNTQELKTILKQPMFNSLKNEDESKLIQNIRKYYNGYNVKGREGQISRFNVLSVTSYLFDVIQRGLEPNEYLKNYWCNTGTMVTQFMNFIAKDCSFLKEQLLKLLTTLSNTDKSYTVSMNREDCLTSKSLQIIQLILQRSAFNSELQRNQQLKKIAILNQDEVSQAVFSFLTYAGYLSYFNYKYRIPNLQVKLYLIELIRKNEIFSLKKPVQSLMDILKTFLKEDDKQVISTEQCKAQMQKFSRQLTHYYFDSLKQTHDKVLDNNKGEKDIKSSVVSSTPPTKAYMNDLLFHTLLLAEIMNHSFIVEQGSRGLVSIEPRLPTKDGQLVPDVFISNKQTKRSIIIKIESNKSNLNSLAKTLKQTQDAVLKSDINRFCEVCFCIVINFKKDLTVSADASRETLKIEKDTE